MDPFSYLCFMSVTLCSLVVTCWERADLLGLCVCDVFLCFCHFPISYGVMGQVRYLIVSIPDHCLLPYFFLHCFYVNYS